MSAGMLVAWLLAAALAAIIVRLISSEPWGTIVPLTLAGAIAGGLVALGVSDTVPAGFAGAVLGAGIVAAARLMAAARQHEGELPES